MKLTIAKAVLAALPLCASAVTGGEYVDFVDPLIGSGGHGHVFVGANVPFGFVQLGPSQPVKGWDWCSGYHYSDSVVTGFAHQHLGGTGIGDLGDIAFMPMVEPSYSYAKFSHDGEKARPGYYSVELSNGVGVELTATQRVGLQRYTFPPGGDSVFVAVNLKQGIGWDAATSCGFRLVDGSLAVGYRFSSGWAADQRVWFAARFSRPARIVSLADTAAVLAFANTAEPLMVKTGLSPVSSGGALLNMEAEVPGWDFGGAVASAKSTWNKELSKIDIETGDNAAKRVFYTALYHTMTAPSVFCDIDLNYRGADGAIHRSPHTIHTTLSLWDTYRAAHPLMTIIHPEKQKDIAATLMSIAREQGRLPVWHLMGNETDCMVGNPGIPVLADLVAKGFVEDTIGAFESMKATALQSGRGLGLLREYGFIPYDKDSTHETVAKALEYAIADDGVARTATLLNKDEDWAYFHARSRSYDKYFDKGTLFMRAVGTDGNFREPFNPFRSTHRQDDYTEGNAWQYTWLVPHDIHGLVSLFPSEKRFAEKLDSLFVVQGDMGAEASPDISGLIGQYAHGNEPSHHIIYMYNYIGQPWKAAPLLRRVMGEMYTDAPDGLCGNEDVGQMSAWYVLSSMGLYQVEPVGGKYAIGSPLFSKATVDVGRGRIFSVVAKNNSPKNVYVQSARLNGKPYRKSYINHRDIMAGGTLELTMGPKPSKFGTAKADRP